MADQTPLTIVSPVIPKITKPQGSADRQPPASLQVDFGTFERILQRINFDIKRIDPELLLEVVKTVQQVAYEKSSPNFRSLLLQLVADMIVYPYISLDRPTSEDQTNAIDLRDPENLKGMLEVLQKSLGEEVSSDLLARLLQLAVKAKSLKLEFELDWPATPHFFQTALAPYLNALSELQTILNKLRAKQPNEIVIREITYNSSFSISLEGATEAVDVVRQTIVPWRRQHVETMVGLSEQKKQINIERTRVEALFQRAQASQERVEQESLLAEAKSLALDSERKRLENDQHRIELNRLKTQMALDIITQFAPDLPEIDRVQYITRLLPRLEILVTSSLEPIFS
jgi:hypothetical protein